MTKEQIIILVLAIAAALLLIALIAVAARFSRYKKSGGNYADKVKIVDGVRYSRDDAITKDGAAVVTLAQGDFLLEQGKTYTADKKGDLLPGKYTALAASDVSHSFKLRASGYVREYSHGDTIVLAQGDTVCAVSCNVILR